MKEENEVMIIGISDNQCDSCCTTETLLDSIHLEMKTSQHLYKHKKIKIARMDMFQKYQLSERERDFIDGIPSLFVFKNNEWYKYNSYYIKNNFLHFINRVLNPYVHLKKEEDVEAFLNMEEEYIELSEFYSHRYMIIGDGQNGVYQKMPKHTRALAFFSDKIEYKNELRLFKKAAQ